MFLKSGICAWGRGARAPALIRVGKLKLLATTTSYPLRLVSNLPSSTSALSKVS